MQHNDSSRELDLDFPMYSDFRLMRVNDKTDGKNSCRLELQCTGGTHMCQKELHGSDSFRWKAFSLDPWKTSARY